MSDIVLFDKHLTKREKEKKIETDIFNFRSKELFINMNEKDIPPKGHKDREAFLDWEEEKSTIGTTINGIYIPGTFYWDMNHFAIMKDVKNSRGVEERIPARPDVRDNDWMIHNALYEAEKNKLNLPLGTCRQASKSKNIGSVFSRDLMLFDNVELLLMASAEIYITPIIQYILVGTENCTDFFRVPRITRDRKAKILNWGFKTKEGEDIIKSKLHIRNAQEGQNTEVAAGLTLNRSAIDEIAVWSFKSSYQTVLPALIGPNGIRSSSMVAFTGGDASKSKDAEEIFLNPKANGFMEFDFEGKKTGYFMPGIYRQDFKIDKKFGEWLGVDDPNSELNSITARVTDVEEANKKLDQMEADAAKSTDPIALTKQRMYFPRQISDMFLSPDKNPFPTKELERHRERLLDIYNGKPVELYKEADKVQWRITSKKPIMQYPVKDQNLDLDAPIIIYDFPKHTEHYALHVAGFDPVNGLGSNAESDSLASIYVMRRNHTDINDPYRNCIVASYTARPQSFRKHYLKNVELLQEFYNMQILHEDSGNGITLYFDERKKSNILMDTFSLQKSINVNSKSNSTKGLKANKPNNTVREEVVLAYLEEELEDGSLGLTRIPDPMLIEELLAYDGMGDGSKNTDRVDAFSYALLQCTTLEKYNKTRPFITHQKIDDKPKQKLKVDAFGRISTAKKSGSFFQF